jgi:S-DNA-T family DNA segregation ATPase FtsK/SpoIIIE
MLYLGAKMSKPERMQAANVTEEEIKKTVQFIKKNNDLAADEISIGEQLDADKSIVTASFDDDEEDELYEEARRVVEEAGKASTSYLQRKLGIGYARAARLKSFVRIPFSRSLHVKLLISVLKIKPNYPPPIAL